MKPIYWLRKPVLDSPWLNNWKWLVPDRMHGSWIFWIVFQCLARTQINNGDLSKFSSKRKQIESMLTCPKLAKWMLTLNYSKSAKWPVWKSTYLQSQGSLKHQIWTVGKHHWNGSTRYSTWGVSDVISS